MVDRFTSPRGRFVQGDLFIPQTKDQQGAPLVVKTGPNAGQPTSKWFIGVAYRKDDPATMPYIMEIAKVAAREFPAMFPQGAQPVGPYFGCTNPTFALKVTDGDGVDRHGKPNSAKEGHAGCWIVKYSTNLQAPEVYQEPHYDPLQRITDPALAPCGYYVRVDGSFQSNKNATNPGLFANPNKVAVCADQQGAVVIQFGPSAAEVFGASPSPATPTPVAPAYTPAPVAPTTPAYIGYIPSPGPAPVAPPPAPPAPPAPTILMTAKANGVTYDQFLASGWTHEQLVQNGYIDAIPF